MHFNHVTYAKHCNKRRKTVLNEIDMLDISVDSEQCRHPIPVFKLYAGRVRVTKGNELQSIYVALTIISHSSLIAVKIILILGAGIQNSQKSKQKQFSIKHQF